MIVILLLVAAWIFFPWLVTRKPKRPVPEWQVRIHKRAGLWYPVIYHNGKPTLSSTIGYPHCANTGIAAAQADGERMVGELKMQEYFGRGVEINAY